MGCANIAHRMVIPAIKNLPDNFELVENQNETFDEDLKRIFKEGWIDE